MAIRAMRRKSGCRMYTKFIEVHCQASLFSVFLSKTKQSKQGETNCEVLKKQKDV